MEATHFPQSVCRSRVVRLSHSTAMKGEVDNGSAPHASRGVVRRFTAGVLPVLLATSALTFRHQALASTSTRPNVVLILTDDQRAHALWAMPHVKQSLVQH